MAISALGGSVSADSAHDYYRENNEAKSILEPRSKLMKEGRVASAGMKQRVYGDVRGVARRQIALLHGDMQNTPAQNTEKLCKLHKLRKPNPT